MSESDPLLPPGSRSSRLIGASARPLYDKATFVQTIKDEIPASALLQGLVREFEEGEILLLEGGSNDNLYIILDGYVAQAKESQKINTQLGLHGPGDFIGLLSFQTGETIFTTARAASKVVTLCLDHRSFDIFLSEYPQTSKTLQGLIFSNLADRYRNVVMLHVEVATLTRELEQERNHLKKVIKELERTRNALISQEKMATLGELTAGLAHEINNPASALLRSVDFLMQNLPAMGEKLSTMPADGMVRFFFEAGMKRVFADTASHRKRMKELVLEYPHLPRGLLRLLAEMDDELMQKISLYLQPSANRELLQLLLDAYQSGVFLNNIRLSTSRIEHLVKSLKSYSRKGEKNAERADVREGIRETLQIMGNRLRDIKVTTQLDEPAYVNCFVGELNQVWTNIIINACDAMENKGELWVSCHLSEDQQRVVLIFADTGPGVPDKIKKRIFDSSFSTKTAGGDFGLGIGLAISKTIIEKHHGTIEVTDRKGGGAVFVINLPVAG